MLKVGIVLFKLQTTRFSMYIRQGTSETGKIGYKYEKEKAVFTISCNYTFFIRFIMLILQAGYFL